jgi:hypothetical protein
VQNDGLEGDRRFLSPRCALQPWGVLHDDPGMLDGEMFDETVVSSENPPAFRSWAQSFFDCSLPDITGCKNAPVLISGHCIPGTYLRQPHLHETSSESPSWRLHGSARVAVVNTRYSGMSTVVLGLAGGWEARGGEE